MIVEGRAAARREHDEYLAFFRPYEREPHGRVEREPRTQPIDLAGGLEHHAAEFGIEQMLGVDLVVRAVAFLVRVDESNGREPIEFALHAADGHSGRRLELALVVPASRIEQEYPEYGHAG